MSSVNERYNLIVQAGQYSAQEAHTIAKWLCGIRDFDDDPILTAKIETMLQAFINRKKLGIPVVAKKMEEEFKLFDHCT
jgi:hypothetical protein